MVLVYVRLHLVMRAGRDRAFLQINTIATNSAVCNALAQHTKEFMALEGGSVELFFNERKFSYWSYCNINYIGYPNLK